MSLSKADILYKTIKSGIETEKSYSRLESDIYTFLVENTANKLQVKQAIECLYEGVNVVSVRIVLRKGKVKKTKRGFSKRSDSKFAFVKLSGNLDRIANLQISDSGSDGDRQ